MRYRQRDIRPTGWALECRVLAEDPERGFAPSLGQITRLMEPGGPGIRVDSGICEGMSITPYYDSLLAKLVVWGESRAVAIVRMRRALAEYSIIGVTTNLDLLRAILNSQRFQGGQFHTRFIEEEFQPEEVEGEDQIVAALTLALLDYHRRGDAPARSGDRISPWKMQGRRARLYGRRR
jgi:acetyl/propionyl-CoA carboxylase alpha subunit